MRNIRKEMIGASPHPSGVGLGVELSGIKPSAAQRGAVTSANVT